MELVQVFALFFLGFILVAVVIALLTKKPFIFWVGNMLMVAAVALFVWGCIINDGSDGWGFLAVLILWGLAAGSFTVGFILYKVSVSQMRKKAQGNASVVKTEEPV